MDVMFYYYLYAAIGGCIIPLLGHHVFDVNREGKVVYFNKVINYHPVLVCALLSIFYPVSVILKMGKKYVYKPNTG